MSISSYYKPLVAEADELTRVQFIRKTYWHLALAILAFAGVSWGFLVSGISEFIFRLAFSTSFAWFLIIGAFVGVSYIANSMAYNTKSLGVQYLGLLLYILVEAVVFAPLLLVVSSVAGGNLIWLSGILTLVLVAALTFITFLNQIDFSFLRGFLMVGGFVALGVIVLGAIFGFSLGLWFSGAMILFAAGAILYDTSNIMLRYSTNQYVSASLSLFASVALLFYYILTFLLSFTSNKN